MKARHIAFCATSLAALLALLSCTANGGSIYATVEKEQKTADSTLADTLTVADIGEASAGGPYYVAAGAIFQGTVSGPLATGGTIIWNTGANATAPRVWPPTSGALSGAYCNTMATYNGALWCGLIGSGTVYGLYEIGTDGSNPTQIKGTANILLDASGNPKQISLLRNLNGNLFVVASAVTASNPVYEVDSYNGTTWTTLSFPNQLNNLVADIAFDGLNYWLASGISIYTATGSAFSAYTMPGFTLAASDQINGVFADSHVVIVSTKLSGLYVSKDRGASWTNVTTPQVGGLTVGFLCAGGPIDPSDTTNPANTTYLVGSDGYGYYVLSAAGTMSLTRFADNTILLYAYAVRRILVDGTTVLMGTAAEGLWRASFDPASSTGALYGGTAWVHE